MRDYNPNMPGSGSMPGASAVQAKGPPAGPLEAMTERVRDITRRVLETSIQLNAHADRVHGEQDEKLAPDERNERNERNERDHDGAIRAGRPAALPALASAIDYLDRTVAGLAEAGQRNSNLA